MLERNPIDATDARLLLALAADPRATVISLAESVGVSRNTVQARLARFDTSHVLGPIDPRIDPAALGYSLTAFIDILVTQRLLGPVATALAGIPEVIEVIGLSGETDLLVRVVARDADDLYRVAGQILSTEGVERTETSLAMRRLVDYRVTPLLERIAGRRPVSSTYV
jgi:DNA-binding Lrp family transcriptional regulator